MLAQPGEARFSGSTGSQTGSKRRQASGHIRRQPAMVGAARSPIRSHSAAVSGWQEAAMPPDAQLNSDAPPGRAVGSFGRVAEMQAELHRWAAADAAAGLMTCSISCMPGAADCVMLRARGPLGSSIPAGARGAARIRPRRGRIGGSVLSAGHVHRLAATAARQGWRLRRLPGW